jgi:hypothetical protein
MLRNREIWLDLYERRHHLGAREVSEIGPPQEASLARRMTSSFHVI